MNASADNLTIETPEQTSLDFPLAGVGSRFIALAADTAIQILAGLAIFLAVVLTTPFFHWLSKFTGEWLVALLFLAIFFLNSGYFAFFEAVWNGQTPGKRFSQIRVIKDDGRPISAFDSIARNLLRIADELPGLYIAGVISILLSKQNKRLGDYVAGTVVIHEKTIQEARPFLDVKADVSAPVYDTSRLTLDEMRVIEAFLNRRDSLDPALRTAMAAKIAKRIGVKLESQVGGWPHTENFLETVYEQYRSTGRLHATK